MNTSTSTITTTITSEILSSFKSIPAGIYSLPDDTDRLAQELLVNLGLVTRTGPSPMPSTTTTTTTTTTLATESVTETAPETTTTTTSRKRTVSKKMKDSLLASGKSEDDLKRIIDAYKKASDSDIAAAGGSFESFAASVLAAPSTSDTSTSTPAAKTPKTPKADQPNANAPSKPSKNKKKAEKGRISWTAAEKKVFKEVIESSGGLVTPELTLTFTTYINDLSPEAFDSLALSGHMRAWISSSSSSSSEPRAGAGLMTPTEYDLARSIENKHENKHEDKDKDEDEDEDLLEIDHNGETLLIGENSGKIFVPSPQEGMPDVMVGIAGQGKYKAVKKPSA